MASFSSSRSMFPGTGTAECLLNWREFWSNYPLNEMDMILVRSNSTFDFSGATHNVPERAMVKDPLAGTWIVIVDGFGLPSELDKFELRVALDGRVLR